MPKLILTSPACPVCRSLDADLREWAEEYVLAECLHCRMVWDPRPPSDQRLVYQEQYFRSGIAQWGYPDYQAETEYHRMTFRRRLRIAEKRLGFKGKLLDVGCALGDCLMEAQALGWPSPQGLEVSKYAVNVAQKRNLSVSLGHLLHHPFAPETFDVIFLQDVLEHTSDPMANLSAAYRLLRPGGWLLVITPNYSGLMRRVLRRRWFHFKPGEHLVYFTRRTISRALRSSGLMEVQTTTASSSMSVGYLFERLQFYHRGFFSRLKRLCVSAGLGHQTITIPTGEIAAWATKPRAQSSPNSLARSEKK